MDGESAPAAGIRVAVGAEQAQTAGLGAIVGLEVPVADNRFDSQTKDAPRGAQGDEEAEALHAAWCRAAGELHGASVACPANPGRPADSAFSALSQVGCLNKTQPPAFHSLNTALTTPPKLLFKAGLNNRIQPVEHFTPK